MFGLFFQKYDIAFYKSKATLRKEILSYKLRCLWKLFSQWTGEFEAIE